MFLILGSVYLAVSRRAAEGMLLRVPPEEQHGLRSVRYVTLQNRLMALFMIFIGVVAAWYQFNR